MNFIPNGTNTHFIWNIFWNMRWSLARETIRAFKLVARWKSGWFWWEPFKMSNLDMLSIQASLNNGVGYYRVDSFVITLEKLSRISSFWTYLLRQNQFSLSPISQTNLFSILKLPFLDFGSLLLAVEPISIIELHLLLAD